MLSRVAENLYWLGRYLERAENVARMADVDYHASVESGAHGLEAGSLWEPLIIANGSHRQYLTMRATDPQLSGADFLILAESNPNSIRSTVVQARTLARAVREHISREVWEEINQLYFTLSDRPSIGEADVYGLCRTVKHSVETAIGLYENTALHDEGRDWFRCGLFIERADMTSRILDAKYHILLPSPTEVGGPLDRLQWTAVLKSASAWEAFRKLYRDLSAAAVAELLLFRPDFPRSLLFCVRALEGHYHKATARTPAAQAVVADRMLTLLALDIAALDVDGVFAAGLHESLKAFQSRLTEVHQAMNEHLFLEFRVEEEVGEAAQ